MDREAEQRLLVKKIKKLDKSIAWATERHVAEKLRIDALAEERDTLAEEYLAMVKQPPALDADDDTDPWS